MRRDILVLVVVILVVGIMISAAVVWSRRSAPQQNAAQNNSGTLGDVHGQLAPDFQLKNLNGGDFKLSDLRGKAVVLNFWATYCQPCKLEMPWLEELHKRYAPQGVEFVGVTMDDVSEDTIRKYVKDVNVTYTILVGKEAVGDQYGGVQFLPTTFYIGRDGKIVERVFGISGQSDIEDNIKRAMAGKPAGQAATSQANAQSAPAAKGQ